MEILTTAASAATTIGTRIFRDVIVTIIGGTLLGALYSVGWLESFAPFLQPSLVHINKVEPWLGYLLILAGCYLVGKVVREVGGAWLGCFVHTTVHSTYRKGEDKIYLGTRVWAIISENIKDFFWCDFLSPEINEKEWMVEAQIFTEKHKAIGARFERSAIDQILLEGLLGTSLVWLFVNPKVGITALFITSLISRHHVREMSILLRATYNVARRDKQHKEEIPE